MPESFNTANKICIRNNYNKIIAKHLKEKYGYNIVYFGLPSPEAEDIECWLEHISYVIAFQCRDYKQVSTPDLPTDEIDKLVSRLNQWEAAAQIDGYVVYDGFMEEVIFNGYDNSSSGSIPFSYDRTVTLFNLDFCNKITSPQEYVNTEGEYEKKYKFELIDKILEFQKGISKEDQKFVLFLTINAGYKGQELQDYIDANTKDLLKYNSCSASVKKQFILKHFVEDLLYQKIWNNGFIPHFLPTVFYDGLNSVKMIQFAVMCIKPNETLKNAGVFVRHQKKQDVLNIHPIHPDPDNSSFTAHTKPIDGMANCNLDFMSAFCNSKTYKKYWAQKANE